VTNRDLAQALIELADLVELTAAEEDDVEDSRGQRFRARALRMGAKSIDAMVESAIELARRRKLKDVKGIGEGIARRVEELALYGRLLELDDLRARVGGLLEVARVEGIGPKTTRQLHDQLGVTSLDQLEAIARSGGLAQLKGFGGKRIAGLLAAIDRARETRGRVRLDVAQRAAQPFIDALEATPGVFRVERAGSVRRHKETIGDLDLVVATVEPLDTIAAFANHPLVEVVLARGTGRTSVKTFSGLQLDMMVGPPPSFGALWHHFTGSREHNIALRLMAGKRGMKINEEGIYDGDKLVGGADEMDIYAALGLHPIPVEIRENTGEIEWALERPLPELVSEKHIRGDLHMHTTETDGRATLEEMVAEAARLGREYVAITDHSQALRMVHGLDATRLREQGKKIRELEERLGGRPRILRGIEADILQDGTIDLGPAILGELDWVVGSVHSHFELPREEQTKRIVAAIESGTIDALGHPTGRKLGQRPPYDVDMDEVIAACARTGVALEVNSNPARLDLRDVHCRIAKERRAWLVINTDAHAVPEQSGLRFGIGVARRGWIEPADVLNTRPVEDFLDLVRARRREAAW
jgi:DNA polymerase (family 10)